MEKVWLQTHPHVRSSCVKVPPIFLSASDPHPAAELGHVYSLLLRCVCLDKLKDLNPFHASVESWIIIIPLGTTKNGNKNRMYSSDRLSHLVI